MSNHSTSINVYQALAQKKNILNYTMQPELVYPVITTLNLILKQVQKEGMGLVFVNHQSILKDIERNSAEKKIVCISSEQLDAFIESKSVEGIIVVKINPGEKIAISRLQKIAKRSRASGNHLKWISILAQPYLNQLFKWELRYN